MCGRYSLKRSDFATYEEWMTYRKSQYDDVHSNPIFNTAPTMSLPVIRREGDRAVTDWMRWGLLQPWNKTRSDAYKTFNARSETLLEKPTWKKPLASQRCLVIADGFYEWKTNGKSKQPYRVSLKSRDQFAMAGLYNGWTDPETGEFLTTFSIVTTSANDFMKPLHDRMPVILPDEAHEAWLSSQPGNELLHLLVPFPGDQLVMFAVTPAIGKVSYQEPDSVLPLSQLL